MGSLATDFGLSKPGVDAVSGSAEDTSANRAKSFVGTKEYVAPEVNMLCCVSRFSEL